MTQEQKERKQCCLYILRDREKQQDMFPTMPFEQTIYEIDILALRKRELNHVIRNAEIERVAIRERLTELRSRLVRKTKPVVLKRHEETTEEKEVKQAKRRKLEITLSVEEINKILSEYGTDTEANI